MNQPIQHKRQRFAQLLLAVYLAFFAMYQWHHQISHLHEAHREICQTSPNEQHIHDQAYAPHHCDICNITAPTVLLPKEAIPDFELVTIPSQKQVFFTIEQFSVAFGVHYRLRGPPSV